MIPGQVTLRANRLVLDGQGRPKCHCGKVVMNAPLREHPSRAGVLAIVCPGCGCCFGTVAGAKLVHPSESHTSPPGRTGPEP